MIRHSFGNYYDILKELKYSPKFGKQFSFTTPLLDRYINCGVSADHDDHESFLAQSLAPYTAAVFITIATLLIGSSGLLLVIIQGQRMTMSTPTIWMKFSFVLLSMTLIAHAGDKTGAHGLSLPHLCIVDEHIASVLQIKGSCSWVFDCGARRDISVI